MKLENQVTFKISPNWDCVKPLEWLIENAAYVFTHSGRKGRRPHIVLNTPIDGYDVIEIDYDRSGLTTNGISKRTSWEKSHMMVDYSAEVREFIAAFLREDDTFDFIIPSDLNARLQS